MQSAKTYEGQGRQAMPTFCGGLIGWLVVKGGQARSGEASVCPRSLAHSLTHAIDQSTDRRTYDLERDGEIHEPQEQGHLPRVPLHGQEERPRSAGGVGALWGLYLYRIETGACPIDIHHQ